MKRLSRLAPLALLLVSASAFAHPGHAGGLTAGLLHPFSGLDHLLAMVAVGLWAAQQKQPGAIWKIPLAFVATMLVGGVLGHAGLALPHIEAGIAASVLVLGLLVAFTLRLPTAAAMALVSAFALFHGYAHGAEMPMSASLGAFAIGFALSTATLHGIGMTIGYVMRNRAEILLRLGGVGVALAGAWLAFG
jgi:urease accessory protein